MSSINSLIWRSGGLPGTNVSEFWEPSRTRQDPEVPNLPLESEPKENNAVHNPGHIHVDEGVDDWFLEGEEPVASPVAPAAAIDDGWDWGEIEDFADDVMTIEGTAQFLPAAPEAAVFHDHDFAQEAEYEDPIVDLLEASAGPVQPNAPNLEAPPADLWPWEDDEDEDEALHLVGSETLDAGDAAGEPWWPWDEADDDTTPDDAHALINQPAVPAEPDWDWGEENDDLIEPDAAQAAADAPAEDAWPWWEAFDDDEIPLDAAAIADAVLAGLPADDAWPWDDAADEDLLDDPPQAEAARVDALPDDAWPWDEASDDEPIVEGDPVAIVLAEQPLADEPLFDDVDDDPLPLDQHALIDQPSRADDGEPWIDEDDEPADFGSAPVADDDAPQATAWDFDDADDEPIDDGAPVGADQPPLPLEVHELDETDDEWDGGSEPVRADAAQAEPPPEDAFFFGDELDDEPADDAAQFVDAAAPIVLDAEWPWDEAEPEPDDGDAPVGADEPGLACVTEWPWDDEDTDEDPHEPPVGPDQPGVPPDTWDWSEPEAEDDDWWAGPPWLDFIALAGQQAIDEWAFDDDNVADDEWWPLPVPDQRDEMPCSVLLALAYDRIAELEALLAEALARPAGGNTGNGGDDFRDYDDADRRRRERIDRNNQLILALAGALLRDIDNPEDEP